MSWAQLGTAGWKHSRITGNVGNPNTQGSCLASSATIALIPRLRVRKHGKDKTKPNFLVAATHLKALPSELGCRVGNGRKCGAGNVERGAGQCLQCPA